MRSLYAVVASLLLLAGSLPILAATTSYEWGFGIGGYPDSTSNVLHVAVKDSLTGAELDASLPQWYYPFGRLKGEYADWLGNWGIISAPPFCDSARNPNPSLTFQELQPDGSFTTEQADEHSITCTSWYFAPTDTLTTTVNFTGSNGVTGAPFSGKVMIVSQKGRIGGWNANDVKWSVTYQ
jgi:hypothetical protein